LNQISKKIRNAGFRAMVSILLIFGLLAGAATASENTSPEADAVLKAMSDFLGQTKAFSADADIDLEIVSHSGQKFQLSSSGTILMNRPSNFYITKKGMVSDIAFIYDGSTLTLHGKRINAYAQIKVDGTTDDAILAYEMETGIPAPGADLLLNNAYEIMSSGVLKGMYIGKAVVDGYTCHHLAFREDKTDWQLWVRDGNMPLPMKYVITTKWHTAAPQYEIRFRNWNTNPSISPEQFRFTPPSDAVQLENIFLSETEGLLSGKEDK